jgi:hypothetical protein
VFAQAIDAGGAVCHDDHMSVIRHIGILVLLVALLPWGAFGGARIAPWAQDKAVVTAEAAGDVAGLPKLQDIRAIKQCRSGVLPGGCGSDAGLLAAFRFDPPLVGDVAAPPEGPDLRRGIVPWPAADPPRAV